VFEQLQRRPREGDEVYVGDFHARVTEVDGMRISRVLLTRLDTEEETVLEDAEAAERRDEDRER
jgi:CBS domain containing-hemolysin-like protein